MLITLHNDLHHLQSFAFFRAKMSFFISMFVVKFHNILQVAFLYSIVVLFQEVSPHSPLEALRSSIKQIEILVVIYTSLFVVVAVRNEKENKIDFKLKVFCHYSLKSAWIFILFWLL